MFFALLASLGLRPDQFLHFDPEKLFTDELQGNTDMVITVNAIHALAEANKIPLSSLVHGDSSATACHFFLSRR